MHQNDEVVHCEPSEPQLHGLTSDDIYTCPEGKIYNSLYTSLQSIRQASILNGQMETNLGPIKHHTTLDDSITMNLIDVKINFNKCKSTIPEH